MAEKLIVVEGATLKFKNTEYSGDITVQGSVPVPPAPPSVLSQSVKSGGKAAYFAIGFAISNFTGDGVKEGIGVGLIVGTSEKSKGNGISFVVEDNEVETTAAMTVSPFTSTLVTVVVDDPGQSVVRVK